MIMMVVSLSVFHVYAAMNFEHRLRLVRTSAWTQVESRLNLDRVRPHYMHYQWTQVEPGSLPTHIRMWVEVGWSGFNHGCNSNEYQLTRVQTVSCALCADAQNPGSIHINLVWNWTRINPCRSADKPLVPANPITLAGTKGGLEPAEPYASYAPSWSGREGTDLLWWLYAWGKFSAAQLVSDGVTSRCVPNQYLSPHTPAMLCASHSSSTSRRDCTPTSFLRVMKRRSIGFRV